MKKIELTQGKYAMVDDSDFVALNQYAWQFKRERDGINGYAVGRKYIGVRDGREIYDNYSMHRLLMDAPKNMLVDHVNGNGLDNRRRNLRLCTKSENLCNRGPQKNNTSGHKNIVWHAQDKMWRVLLVKGGKKHDGGLFHDIEDAVKARDRLIKQVHGKFARTEAF